MEGGSCRLKRSVWHHWHQYTHDEMPACVEWTMVVMVIGMLMQHDYSRFTPGVWVEGVYCNVEIVVWKQVGG